LIHAIDRKREDALQLLIEHKATVSFDAETFWNSPLLYAIIIDDRRMTELLYDIHPGEFDTAGKAWLNDIARKRRRFRRSALCFLGVLRRRVRVPGATGPGGRLPLDMVRLLGQHVRTTRFDNEWLKE
jgi:hypothetical protein